MSSDQVREQFEAAMRERYAESFWFDRDTKTGDYIEPEIRWRWEGYQFALSRSPAEPQQALTETEKKAVKIIDDALRSYDNGMKPSYVFKFLLEERAHLYPLLSGPPDNARPQPHQEPAGGEES
jgi:hypothetical protein